MIVEDVKDFFYLILRPLVMALFIFGLVMIASNPTFNIVLRSLAAVAFVVSLLIIVKQTLSLPAIIASHYVDIGRRSSRIF